MTPRDFARRLLGWYADHGRHDLPWQHPREPYRVWISEIMLQQTQVATVIPYFERFMQRFPDVCSLAGAELDDVLHLWTGLGYYARARNLHRAALQIRDLHAGVFPLDYEAVASLPGIGRSTASAILAQAAGQRHAILDGNVKRVLTRFHAVAGWPGRREVEQRLWTLAEAHTPARDCAAYTQAIMDLGATVCRRRRPDCAACPVSAGCRAHALGRQEAFPEPRPRRELPVRSTTMLLITDSEKRVLLERRPPTGIWGGLWSLPECPAETEPREWGHSRLGLYLQEFTAWPVMRHTFSHFHLDIRPLHTHAEARGPLRVMEGDGLVWYNTRRPDARGLPAPVEHLLNRLDEADTDTARQQPQTVESTN